ncbi:hypothetical protein BKA70DRAFT_1224012 [Coprinopsis sp. MPI-PUGE-AT-0042]|nr:hypothetical protein BKA70DRAFT_1224012 [Coprinopsis sp. MPI-PUGE-AT-0042]
MPVIWLQKSTSRSLSFDLTVPIYAFFKPDPIVETIGGRECQVFKCAASHCNNQSRDVRRYLDTKDASSTSNLRKHALKCWGEEAVTSACTATSAADVRIDMMFQRTGKGKVSYSHRQHTSVENKRKDCLLGFGECASHQHREDEHFLSLMKTGRPEYKVPSPSTVSRDIKAVFAKARQRMAKLLASFMRAFDLAKSSKEGGGDDDVAALVGNDEEDMDLDDAELSDEGWVDALDELTGDKRDELNAEVEPLRLALGKERV